MDVNKIALWLASLTLLLAVALLVVATVVSTFSPSPCSNYLDGLPNLTRLVCDDR